MLNMQNRERLGRTGVHAFSGFNNGEPRRDLNACSCICGCYSEQAHTSASAIRGREGGSTGTCHEGNACNMCDPGALGDLAAKRTGKSFGVGELAPLGIARMREARRGLQLLKIRVAFHA